MHNNSSIDISAIIYIHTYIYIYTLIYIYIYIPYIYMCVCACIGVLCQHFWPQTIAMPNHVGIYKSLHGAYGGASCMA